MDPLQTLMLPTIDDDGFAAGSIAQSAVNDRNAGKVVASQVPSGPLPDLFQWHWDGVAWSARPNYSGHSWYNPADTEQMHHSLSAVDAPPAGWVYWQPGQNKIIPDEQRLQRVRHLQWEKIKARRDARKAAGTRVGNLWFHSDADSRTQQLGLVMFGANLPANLQWKTMSGVFVTMTPSLAQQIFTATAYSDQAIFAKAEQHKAAMEAATDPESYDFTTGWPAIYGETP